MVENEIMNNEVQKDSGKASVAKGSYFAGLILLLMGIAASVAASFLTFFHIGITAEMTAFEGDLRLGSIITFAILFVVLGAVLFRDGGAKGYCFVGGLAVLGEALVHYLYVTQRMSNINILWINLGDAVKLDIGFYAMVAGGIVTMLAGLFMPPITKKPGVIIILVVVCGLIAAGVIVSLAVGPGSNGKKKSNKDEREAKSDDISFLYCVMGGAEITASMYELDGYIAYGSTFTIALSNGKINLSFVSNVDSTGNALVMDAWEDWINKRLEEPHDFELESSEFQKVSGSITGTVQKDGNLSWTGSGISALTNYSSDLRNKLR